MIHDNPLVTTGVQLSPYRDNKNRYCLIRSEQSRRAVAALLFGVTNTRFCPAFEERLVQFHPSLRQKLRSLELSGMTIDVFVLDKLKAFEKSRIDFKPT